ncbi:hypothetical protein SAMN04488012_104236 [Palleronia salina]|uniref:Uncharacterized protein n=2 Tax=Palleronia TaxID=315422 RepID=A0A1M6G826_9RHOB|nr:MULTISPECIES: hypothetical protein [Palleronia]SEN48268.1 hypothetical protein SAMN04488011_104230 [Palleronia pelagia]SHJ06054.1 hypothetical protein SAMN04488012_104236 [Palleronia salina]
MKSLPTLFFASAALFALIGMVWGIQMAASHDHTLSPAHGHLNLLGFVAMAVFGTYYALTPAAMGRMATLHFLLAVATVVFLVPGIAIAIPGGSPVLSQIGSILALATMALFGLIVVRNGVGPVRAA